MCMYREKRNKSLGLFIDSGFFTLKGNTSIPDNSFSVIGHLDGSLDTYQNTLITSKAFF